MKSRLAPAVVIALLAAACSPAAVVPSAERSSSSPAVATSASDYFLPAALGADLVVTNGNSGTLDHAAGKQGQYAFDFGTSGNKPFTVVASRGGTVIGAEGSSAVQCKDENTRIDGTALPGCWALANYILIDHGDGKSDLYMHLAPGSIPAGIVVGARICTGTPIGTDGKSGYATAIHLHFQIEDTPTDRAAAGWWWHDSTLLPGFADPDVIKAAPDGIPGPGTYRSGNAGTPCIVPPQAAVSSPTVSAPPPPSAPTVTPIPRPTPKPTPPAAPTGVTFSARGTGNTIHCDGNECEYLPPSERSPWRLTWKDVNSETGYRVYVAYEAWYWAGDPRVCVVGVHEPRHLLKSLPANATSLDGTWTAEGDGTKAHPYIQASTYYVVAVNGAGASKATASNMIVYADVGSCTTP